ncbi:MAG: hypothetical protein HUJ66_02190 [Oscillospiraceae bacterium]|nr:hypothetical protein [Oscillospiraceae bacterium]
MSSFKDLRIVDNFYQTSSYFPMPTVMVSTLAEDGTTSVGSYSLCFPYYIAKGHKGYYAMILEARNSSNTAQHILAGRKHVALNFMTDEKENYKKIVAQGWPGDTPAEKMKNFGFHLEEGLCAAENPEEKRPMVVSEAYQVMECTWVDELEDAYEDIGRQLVDGAYPPPYRHFNGITTEFGAHFILRIDKVLMKPKFYDNIINGVKANLWPNVLICHGYRDSKNFWFAKTKKLRPQMLPLREATLSSVRYAADRTDPNIHFTDDALEKLLNVPRIFLPTALKGCVNWAKENGVTEITAREMDIINDKRAKEKGKTK